MIGARVAGPPADPSPDAAAGRGRWAKPGTPGAVSAAELAAWLLFTGLLVLIIGLVLFRYFNRDELEAMQAAWKIYDGQKIYIDFFQLHAPFLYYSLYPFFMTFGDSLEVLQAARWFMFAQLIAIYATVYLLAAEISGRSVAAVSVFFLAALTIFTEPGTEIRPDVPQTLFALLGTYLLFRYLRVRRTRLLLASGLCFAAAFLFLQKAAALIALVGLMMVARALRHEVTLRELVIFGGAVIVGLVPYLMYLAVDGSLQPYIFYNFVFPGAYYATHPTRIVELVISLARIIVNNSIVLLLFLYATFFVSKTREQWELWYLGVCSLVGLVGLAGAYWPAYFMPGLPFVAIIAAQGLLSALGAYRRLLLLALAFAFAVPALSYGLTIVTGKERRAEQMELLRYAHAVTDPDDYVYNDDIIYSLFRKDIDFFYFDARELFKVVEKLRGRAPDPDELVERYRPKVIADFRTENVIDPRIADRYDHRYEPVAGAKGMYVLRGHDDGAAGSHKPTPDDGRRWSCLDHAWDLTAEASDALSPLCKLGVLALR